MEYKDEVEQKVVALNDVNDSDTVITISENTVTLRGFDSNLVSILASALASHGKFNELLEQAAELVLEHKNSQKKLKK